MNFTRRYSLEAGKQDQDTSLIELLEQGKKRFTQRGLDVTEEND